eukprot:6460524-Amphidinium_carterae.1
MSVAPVAQVMNQTINAKKIHGHNVRNDIAFPTARDIMLPSAKRVSVRFMHGPIDHLCHWMDRQ